jgi:hypothetical protein
MGAPAFLAFLGLVMVTSGIIGEVVFKTMKDGPQDVPQAPKMPDPVAPAVPKETDDATITKELANLDGNPKETLVKISRLKPNQRRAEVIQKVMPYLKNDR